MPFLLTFPQSPSPPPSSGPLPTWLLLPPTTRPSRCLATCGSSLARAGRSICGFGTSLATYRETDPPGWCSSALLYRFRRRLTGSCLITSVALPEDRCVAGVAAATEGCGLSAAIVSVFYFSSAFRASVRVKSVVLLLWQCDSWRGAAATGYEGNILRWYK